MKKIHRMLATVLSAAIMLSMAGCGADPDTGESVNDYPVMELVDISNMELLVVEDDAVKYQVPVDTWIAGTNVNEDMVIVLAESYGTQEQVAVNVVVGDHEGSVINDEFAKGVAASINSDLGFSVRDTQLLSFNGRTICRNELAVAYTDEVIDNMLEYGVLTEDELGKIGGREIFLSMPPYESVSVYMVIGDKRITCGGSYFNQEQRDEVMELINIILQTIELK